MAFNNFEGGAAGAWTPSLLHGCTGSSPSNWGYVLGGPGVAGTGYVASWASTMPIPTHTQARVLGAYYQIDTWDGETGWVKFNGTQVWVSPPFTTAATSTSAFSYCGSTGFTDAYVYLNATAAHTASKLTVEVGSTLNQPPSDESFALDKIGRAHV